jgi:hypothetical protein
MVWCLSPQMAFARQILPRPAQFCRAGHPCELQKINEINALDRSAPWHGACHGGVDSVRPIDGAPHQET